MVEYGPGVKKKVIGAGGPQVRPIQDPSMLAVLDGPDPQLAYEQKMAEGRLIRNDDGSVTLLRMADILKINRDRSVLGVGGLGTIGGADRTRPLVPLEIDGPEHTRWRKVLDPVFAPKQVAKVEPEVRSLARELLDGFAGGGGTDVYTAFCQPLPQTIFLRLLGLPVEDIHILDALRADPEAVVRRNEYLRVAIDERIASGEHREDLLGWLIETKIDDRVLSAEEILDVAILFTIAGLDTVGSSLACVIGRLARHPDELARLAADPGLWPHAIEEYLRFESPVTHGYRLPTEDVDLGGGETIAAGTVVHISWSAANLDPDAFDDPHHVHLERPANPHIAFASGWHRCLGSHLARMELRVALEEFHARIPSYRFAEGFDLRFVSPNPRHPTGLPLVWEPA
jgi:cytochrome P450